MLNCRFQRCARSIPASGVSATSHYYDGPIIVNKRTAGGVGSKTCGDCSQYFDNSYIIFTKKNKDGKCVCYTPDKKLCYDMEGISTCYTQYPYKQHNYDKEYFKMCIPSHKLNNC